LVPDKTQAGILPSTVAKENGFPLTSWELKTIVHFAVLLLNISVKCKYFLNQVCAHFGWCAWFIEIVFLKMCVFVCIFCILHPCEQNF